MSSADECNDLADRLFAAIANGDVDAVADLYADDVVVWHNFDGVEQTRDANLAVLAWLIANVDDLRYEDVQRHTFTSGFVQQHVLRATKNGHDIEVPSCLVVRVEHGRVARIDEYLDTAHLRPLLE